MPSVVQNRRSQSHRVQSAAGAKNGKFSLAAMRPALHQAVDLLFKAVVKQNPDASIDRLEEGLRRVVNAIGHDKPLDLDNDGDVDAVVEASVGKTHRNEYNLAADAICMAYDLYREDKVREAISALADALECPGMDEVYSRLNEANSDTDVAEAVMARFEEDAEFQSLLNVRENALDENETSTGNNPDLDAAHGILTESEADESDESMDTSLLDEEENDDLPGAQVDDEPDGSFSSFEVEAEDEYEDGTDPNESGDEGSEIYSENEADEDSSTESEVDADTRDLAIDAAHDRISSRRRIAAEQLEIADMSDDDFNNEGRNQMVQPRIMARDGIKIRKTAARKLDPATAFLNKLALSGKPDARRNARAVEAETV